MALRGDRRRVGLDVGSHYSDAGSEDGRMFPRQPGQSSSFKAQNLATEIASIEQRCDYLEQRNTWLTEKLLKNQKKFIEKTLVGGAHALMKHSFQAWSEALEIMRYENQLQAQTDATHKCQQVAKELGAALAREQEVSRDNLEARERLELQLEELVATNSSLKRSTDKQAAQIATLTKQINLIMGGLDRNKSEAEAIVDSVDELQKRMREIKKEQGDLPEVQEQPERRVFEDPIRESIETREEAQTLMNSMNGLLRENRMQSKDSSPDRPSRYQGLGATERVQTALRSAEARVPSPMDSRFQTVNQIVAELDGAPRVPDYMAQAGSLSRSGSGGDARSPLFGRQSSLSGYRR